MRGSEWGRLLRAAVGNGVLWGAGWGALALLAFPVLRLVGVVPPEIGWLDALGMAIRIGFGGGVVGAAFALFLRLAYRGRRVRDLGVGRFALVGALVAGVFVPLVLQAINLLTGGELVAWREIDGDMVMAAVFGAVMSGGSLWLAQRAERAERGDDGGAAQTAPTRELASGERWDGVPRRDRATAAAPDAGRGAPRA
ncbi:hypothetical protein [Roseisolibacter sp. H3M3-2]|uniref:hypothetical protein n=1 Tax=Roseisolibacter sp. H3M3-2 TaxID=3031323 RepID=UPI0023DA1F6A|nr:hypothetical protein [Roseisolibacter sp. H3M3-2]MDF1503294.1 hypothetical protein [Roseisolibacter sp. H3M3-2]